MPFGISKTGSSNKPLHLGNTGDEKHHHLRIQVRRRQIFPCRWKPTFQRIRMIPIPSREELPCYFQNTWTGTKEGRSRLLGGIALKRPTQKVDESYRKENELLGRKGSQTFISNARNFDLVFRREVRTSQRSARSFVFVCLGMAASGAGRNLLTSQMGHRFRPRQRSIELRLDDLAD